VAPARLDAAQSPYHDRYEIYMHIERTEASVHSASSEQCEPYYCSTCTQRECGPSSWSAAAPQPREEEQEDPGLKDITLLLFDALMRCPNMRVRYRLIVNPNLSPGSVELSERAVERLRQGAVEALSRAAVEATLACSENLCCGPVKTLQTRVPLSSSCRACRG